MVERWLPAPQAISDALGERSWIGIAVGFI
jgi:hypothetical protein